MLRITVARESATDSEVIAEMVVGKLAGSDRSAGYAAYISEGPSRYSNGVEAAVVVRRHARFQPAMALVAAALAAWQEGRTSQAGEGLRSLLRNSFRRRGAPADWEDPTGHPIEIEVPPGVAAGVASEAAAAPDGAEAAAGTAEARALADALAAMVAAGRPPGPAALRAARALIENEGDPALDALARAVEAVAPRS
ncbi:hypothetical protein [Arenibaculum pallidiluteum]|uniref:hypothetical protein n=1 Tax=Arenibaculum pallidiluteum TaxID=2812559 RepID=UPI001A97A8E1|nr:hypothetical protein [Arenibaculum pallidiluteum]